MARHLLLAAAVVACAAAVGPFFTGCGCGNPIDAVDGTTPQFCNWNAYHAGCNTTLLKETSCSLSCTDPRSMLIFRNATPPTVFTSTSNITCANGVYTTSIGTRVNPAFTHPTCGMKDSCSGCGMTISETCATGMTCKAENLIMSIASDGCMRTFCADGSLRLYDASTGAPRNYTSNQLYCTTGTDWASYSVDGQVAPDYVIQQGFTANCVLPKNCELCSNPAMATSLTQLPVAFRTGYQLATPAVIKQDKTCTIVTCTAPYALYAFNSSTSTLTGLEYTSSGVGKCTGDLYWSNNGQGVWPNNAITACLAPATPTTTAPTTTAPPTTTKAPTTTTKPPTTVWPCGAFENFPLLGNAYACVDGQTRVQCAAGQIIQILTLEETLNFQQASFVTGKGWLAFDCDGSARLFATGQIAGGQCIAAPK